MSFKDLTTSIDAPVDYFVGVLPRGYTEQCTHSIYLNKWHNPLDRSWYGHAGPKLFFGWQHDVSGGEIDHVMSIRTPETSLDTEDAEAVKMRVVCHYLLDLVTDEGLPELFECLTENLEFYKSRQGNEIAQLPANSGVRVTFGQRYNRPAFQIAQE